MFAAIEDLEDFIKSAAKTDVETNLGVTLQEYMGEDPEDPKDWDTPGLASWAMSKYQVQVSQNQLRKMNPISVELMLKEAALEQIAKRDTAGLLKYLEPDYSMRSLCEWAKEKFNVDTKPAELYADPDRHMPKPAAEIVEILQDRAHEAYIPRETQYPIEHAMVFAFGDTSSTEINPYGVDYIRAWACAKYGADLTAEQIRDTSLRQLHDDLVALQEQWMRGGKLEAEVDRILSENKEPIQIAKAINARFASSITTKDVETATSAGEVRAMRWSMWAGRSCERS